MVSTNHLDKKWQFTPDEQKKFTAFIEILIRIDQKNNNLIRKKVKEAANDKQ